MVDVFSLLTEIIAKPTDERADEKLKQKKNNQIKKQMNNQTLQICLI